MSYSLRRRLLPLASTLLLGACAVTQVAPPTPAPPPAAYKEAGGWQRAAADVAVPDDWWQLFKDPVLDDLERSLVIGNETLKASVAAVANARAAFEASRDALWPTASVGLNSAGNGKAQLSVNASWETDLWGRLSMASDGSKASLQASVDDLAAARLSAQSLLAQTYFALRAAEAQQAVYERSVTAYQRSFDLTKVRYDGGVAGRTDLLLAETQLKSAQALLADTQAQRAVFEHSLAVLLGQAASDFAVAAVSGTDALPLPPAVPPMLPSTLLERRPDIAAAQRRVSAAYAQIGVADAAWFPDLTLNAAGQSKVLGLAKLFSAPGMAWAIGGSLVEVLLDGGQRKLASAQARAAADQATSTYRQTVLTAIQEVEDNLVLAERLQQEAQSQVEALRAAQRNVEITLDQYRAGTASYLNVVVAQNAALTNESSLVAVRNRQLAAVNLLLKNIAGRWSVAFASRT